MDKKEIGKRLREFLIGKYGKLIVAAEKLEIGPQNLNKYLNGNYVPGGKFIARLSELGCDTNWLLGIDDYVKTEKVSDVNQNGYEAKDEVIVQQAEEIYKLRKEIRETKVEITKLQNRLHELEASVNEEPKLIKKKSGVKNLN